MNILVTGGAGFIGSNYIRYLLDHYPDYHVVNLDLLTYAGNLNNLKDFEANDHYRFVRGDICDGNLVNSLVSGKDEYEPIDMIVNFAAESHVDRSIKDPGMFVRTNVLGTQTLLDAAYKNNIKKFVQISTDEVYGSLGSTGYFTEDTPLAPNSPYSASKAGADLLVRAYHETFGLPMNITRCTNNFGPYQFPEKLIPLIITNALQDKPIPIYGDGGNIRDWLYVVNHCQAIDLVVHAGKSGEIYNIGGHNEWTNLNITRKILSILNKPENLIQFVEDRPGHDRRYAINASKITQELGWQPEYTFEEAIEKTVKWYIDHREWWSLG